MRKYNITTESSCNCRRPETSDDVYVPRGPKITSEPQRHGPFSSAAAAPHSMESCCVTVKPALLCPKISTACEICRTLGCIHTVSEKQVQMSFPVAPYTVLLAVFRVKHSHRLKSVYPEIETEIKATLPRKSQNDKLTQ